MKKNYFNVHVFISAKKFALIIISVFTCCLYLNMQAGDNNHYFNNSGKFFSTEKDSPAGSFSAFMDVVCPPDISIDCEDDISPANTGEPDVPVENGPYVLSYDDFYLVGCPTDIIRTFTIDYANELADEQCAHTITLIDDDAPVFVPQLVDVTVQCDGDLPPVPDVTLEDCDADADLFFFQSIATPGVEKCILTDAVGVSPNLWSVWLPGLPGGYIDRFVFTEPGCMNVYEDGTAHIIGLVESAITPSRKFNIDVRLINKLNWTQWHSLMTITPPFVNRGFKDDAGLAALGGNLWETWDYYVIDDENSFLFGAGEFAGSVLQLAQAPANLFFGFQVGLAANNKNSNYGLSAWFSYSGHLTVNGINIPISNIGDFNMDAECGPNPNSECTYTVQRHWIAIDQCGNADEMFQTITIDDTEGPVMSSCPADVTVECDAIPTAPIITADDNCVGVVAVVDSVEFIPGACADAGTLIRTWTAEDNCGNVTICKQVITIIDATAPTLSGDPQDMTIQCDDPIPPAAILTATDNCDDDVPVMMASSINNDVDCPTIQIIHRTWTAIDDCGNSTVVDQNIYIQDTTDPIIVCPEEITLPCNSPTPPVDLGSVSATDNCGDPVVSVVGDTFGGDACVAVITRTYLATDACENNATCTQIITIPVDSEGPIVTCPEDVNLACNATEPDSNTDLVSATDNCTIQSYAWEGDDISIDGCFKTVLRTYSATDACENIGYCVQTFTIPWDFELPVITCPADLTLPCNSTAPPANTDLVSASDNCGEPTVSFLSDQPGGTGAGPCVSVITRSYLATDICGNESTCAQLITIPVDLASPVATCPDDITVECFDEVPLADVNSVSVSDNCPGGVSVVHVGDEPQQSECPFVLFRIYEAIDACGNSATCTQVITIDDQTPPVIQCPVDIEIACEEGIPAPNPGAVIANDNCGPVTVTYEGQVIENSVCPLIITQTYKATDACGNFSTCSQTIMSSDDEAPVLSGGDSGEITLECDEILIDVIWPTATDNCTQIVGISLDVEFIPGACENEHTDIYMWSATDECGNVSTQSFIVNYDDTTPPVIADCPDDITVECSDALPDPAEVTATDNCDTDVEILFFETGGPNNADENCNLTSAVGTSPDFWSIWLPNLPGGISDQFVFDSPPGGNLALTGDEGLISGKVHAINNPNQIFNVHIKIINRMNWTEWHSQTTAFPPYVLRSFKDDAGYAALGGNLWTTWDYFVIDQTQSFLIGEGDFTGSYLQLVQAPANLLFGVQLGLAANNTNDHYGLSTWFSYTGSFLGNSIQGIGDVNVDATCGFEVDQCAYDLTRTWIAVDNCGNSSVCTQDITIVDTTPPVFDQEPNDITIECDQVNDPIAQAPICTATDLCNEPVTVTLEIDTFPGNCANNYLISRKWKAVDACGNEATKDQLLTVQDTTDPEITAAEDITIECDQPLPAPDAFATDNCGIATWTVSAVITPDCGQTYVMVRTYIATDECGNTSSDTQTITVVDTTPPTITAADDVTVECTNPLPAPSATTSDNCGSATWTVNPVITPGCGETFIMVRTYTATDECGNIATDTQTITVVDTTPPVIEAAADLTIECGTQLPPPAAEAFDTCGDAEWSVTPVVTPGCGETFIMVRTYTAIDDCGNTSIDTQTITIVDTTDPVFIDPPEDVTIECDDELPQPIVTAEDICGVVTISLDAFGYNGTDCSGQLTRVWTATDECGNSTTHTQIVTIEDNTDPVIVAAPDVTIECGNPIPDPAAEATDNCGVATWSVNAEIIPGCGETFIMIRTYTATDECNNTSTDTQTITVVDTTPPTIMAAADVTVECTDPLPQPLATTSDNCGSATWMVNPVITPGCGETYVMVRTYTATDECGNTSTDTQTLTVVDTTPPVLEAAADLTLECGTQLPPPAAEAFDSCGETEWTVSPEITPGCGETFIMVRTYTATDECGNSSTDTQTITVVDTAPPVFINPPQDITVECDNVPNQLNVTAEDSCGDVAIFLSAFGYNGTDCSGQLTRKWTAIDDCGNSAIHIQIITIEDNTDPVIVAAPDVTIECGNPIPVPEATATDNCGDASWTVSAEVTPGCGESFVMIRTYTATDECDNTSTDTQIITVVDTTPPVFVNPPLDGQASCDSIPDPDDLMATDNCDSDVDISFSEDLFSGGCPGTLVRNWVATDDCGNETTHVQILTLFDSTPPVLIGVPDDITIECDQDLPAVASVTAEDSCDPEVPVDFSFESFTGDCPNEYSIVRTWTAEDECENVITASQTIYIVDTTPPVFTQFPSDITVECDNVPSPGDATANDNCGETTISYSENTVPGICENSYIIERTWLATDECENTSSVTQTVTVQDTTPPTFTEVPEDVTAQCDDVPRAADLIAIDNCDGEVLVEFNEQLIPGDCIGSYTLIRTWMASDNCGNNTVFIQTVVVQDIIAPVFEGNLPVDITVECDNVPIPSDTLANSDTCDPNPVVTFNQDVIPGECPQSYELVWTWTVTDDCGNFTSHTQVVTVIDTTDPEFVEDLPENITVQCDAIPAIEACTATDNCDQDVFVESGEFIVPGNCENSFEIHRFWYAEDDCGNYTEHNQVITVIDTEAPVLSDLPADMNAPCDDIPDAPILSATDNCDDNVSITYVQNELNDGCAGTIQRVWVAEDNCGNVTTHIQTITLIDLIGPGLSGVPADITVECDQPLPEVPVVTALDNCNGPLVPSFIEAVIPGDCPQEMTIVRTWLAVDNCDNETMASQTIEVVDTTPPVLTMPLITTAEVDCSVIDPVLTNAYYNSELTPEEETLFLNGVIDVFFELGLVPLGATDNCGSTAISESSVIILGCDAPEVECPSVGQLTCVFYATDECGNQSEQEITTISIIDLEAPVLSGVPEDITVSCDAVVGPPVVTSDDACFGNLTVEYDESIETGQCIGQYIITRTWWSADKCENIATAVQTISVYDNTAPEFTSPLPINLEVECDAVPDAPAEGEITASDNCGTVTITFEEQIVDGNCADSYTIIRTWIATDDCSNAVSHSQTIFVDDTTPPVFEELPLDISVECDDVPDPFEAVATDNCDTDVTITFTETQFSGGCQGVLAREWVATDNCGNQAIYVRYITLIDTTAPVLGGTPEDITLECNQPIPGPAEVTITDNCDLDPELTFNETSEEGDCPYALTITRTWTGEDQCGNIVTYVQTITIVDTTAPVFVEYPADMTVECDEVPEPGSVLATDNCGEVTYSFSENTLDGDCSGNYTIERTWIATDECNNSTAYTQTVTVQDTTDPVFVNPPADITIECGTPIITPGTSAIDNCDPQVSIFVSIFGYNGVDCEGQLTRIWTAIDDCGNSTTHTQIVTIEDTTDPVFVGNLPGNLNAECDNLPEPSILSAADNCDNDVEITVSDNNIAGNCTDSFTIVRTYTATDNCGNTTAYDQSIFVDDTTPPVFDSTPGDIMVPCDDVPDPLELTASDNCDTEVSVTFLQTEFNGGCLSILKRDWTAVDNCGNTTMWTQYVSLQDEVDPVLSGVPADLTLECDSETPLPANVTATDNCDEDVTVSLIEDVIQGNCIGSYTLVRTWTATDNCQNISSASQTITFIDTTAPLIESPALAFAVKSCDAVDYGLFEAFESGALSFADSLDYLEFLHELVESCGLAPTGASDNCSYGDISVLMTQTLGANDVNCPEKGRFTVYWQAMDDCGNLSEIVTKYITIVDEEAPVLIGVPENTTASCDMIPDPDDVTAEDNCDVPTVILTESTTAGQCENSYTITRTWTATDDCGNTSSASQVIGVYDETPPVLTGGPANISVECDNVPDPATLSATDNCDNDVTIVITENEIPGECENSYTLERTWTATDNCGNSSSYTQVIEVSDTTPPVLNQLPISVMVDCNEVPDPAEINATDNCDLEVDVTLVETMFSGGCIGVIERKWTAIDNCGNVASYSQFITLTDTQAPVFVNPPADITVDCNGVPPAEDCVAIDDCNSEITYGYDENTVGDDCYAFITRIWTATDECQNTATHVQNITVIDDIPPVIVGGPSDVTVSCDDIPVAPVVNATDNCSEPVVAITSEVISEGCPYTITRTWTASDDCGNSSTHIQVITVVDNEDPTFDNIPLDMTVDCNEMPGPEDVTASDNCDDDVTVTLSQSQNSIDPCAVIYTRTWTATDNCGNSVSQTQTIIAVDTTPPVFDPNSVPPSTSAECDNIPAIVVPTATDDCQAPVSITMDTDTEPIDDCSYLIIRTWTASDGCGNSSSVSQVITVDDTTAPVFTDFPADATFTCGDEIPEAVEPVAVDNCNSVSYNLVETIEGNTNPLKDCALTTPIDVLGDVWAVWLPTLPGSTGNFVFDANGGQFTEVDLGGGMFEATLTGRVHDENDPTKIWRIETKVINKLDWDTWSNLSTTSPPFVNRSFKDDAGYAALGGGLQVTWDFWELDGANSTLIGEGAYAGDVLHLAHAPANLYFGFQVGQAANNRNGAFGGSSWFSYTGTLDGSSVSGVGDFGFEADCPPCEYTITRVWTATDACGNSVSQTQVITVNAPVINNINDGGIDNNFDTELTNDLNSLVGLTTLGVNPNPASTKTTVVYSIPENDHVRLDLFDLSGKLIVNMYSGFAEGTVEYRLELDASDIPNGIYISRLTTSASITNEKLIITK